MRLGNTCSFLICSPPIKAFFKDFKSWNFDTLAAQINIEDETVRYSQGVETIEIRPEEVASEVFEDDPDGEEPSGEDPMLVKRILRTVSRVDSKISESILKQFFHFFVHFSRIRDIIWGHLWSLTVRWKDFRWNCKPFQQDLHGAREWFKV